MLAVQTEAEIAEDIAKTADYAARQDVEKSVEAGKLAHAILDEMLDFAKPGIRESELREFGLARYAAHGIERPWHTPYIRFGPHTLLTYRDKAKEDRVLGESDILFADIGTVKNGIEGDAGRTIVFGDDENFHALARASKDIFDEMLGFWRANDPAGRELHAACCAAAEKRGLVFNLDPAGHLIGSFPHKGWKHGMNRFPDKLQKGLWVLEIQIRHPELPCGAFFEDLLV